MKLTIKPIKVIGIALSLYMAYSMWGIKGFWFTLGLILIG